MIHEDNMNMLANINAIKQSTKGTSFRINKWTPDTYYMYNEQYIDWVHIDGALLVCKRTHVSNEDNKPIITIENKKLVLKDSPCWEFIFGLESSITIDNISQLRFENGILQLSNDNGNTWETILDTNNISPAPMRASVVNTHSTTEESSANVNLVDNELQFTFAIQKGRDGKDGKDGKDGVNGNPGKDGIDGTDGKDGIDGTDGKDGAGIEYIFALSSIETVIWENSGLELPDNDWVFDNPNEPWCDEPKSVSSEYPIQWVSKRVKPEGSSVWDNWSTPTVWSTYGTIGMTTTVVKLWKRSDSPIQEITPPEANATYNIFTNKLIFAEGNTNGWSHNGASNTGRYLYSLGVSISTNTSNYIIKPENWTILNLESVDGIDGSGQSSVTMTVDPDSIIVNIDSNNKTKGSREFSCTANYYYGGKNINSNIEISSSDKYIVDYEDKNTTEHVFTITINKDVEFSNVEHLMISLTPESQDLGEDGILSLPVLNRSILLNPIKSEDVWGISLNKDNIIITDRTLSNTTVLTANVTKNYVKYTGEDVKLSYKLPNKNYTDYTGDININNTTITSGEIEFKLELNNVPILYQSVSIIYVKDGANGKDGVDGSNGKDGADGKSPYFISLSNDSDQLLLLNNEVTNYNQSFKVHVYKGEGEISSDKFVVSVENKNVVNNVVYYTTNDVTFEIEILDDTVSIKNVEGILNDDVYYIPLSVYIRETQTPLYKDFKLFVVNSIVDYDLLLNTKVIKKTDDNKVLDIQIQKLENSAKSKEKDILKELPENYGVQITVDDNEPIIYKKLTDSKISLVIEDLNVSKKVLVQLVIFDDADTIVKVVDSEEVIVVNDGRGINNTTNYYLISDKSTGIESPTEDTIISWQKDQFDYEKCDENTPYVWLSNCIEYSDGEKIFTTPNIVFMYNIGKDGRSIKSVYEYYMYSTLKDGEDNNYIPEPDWDNYNYISNPETLTNLDGTTWTCNNVPDLNEGESLLWNIEVIIYDDVNDGYSHTAPIQLSNRAHEIENIQEYYKASNEFSNEIFDSESLSLWTLDRPELSNETPYLWNAELITYVNGSKKYTVPNRIDIFLKENVVFETSTKVLTGYIDQNKTISFKEAIVNYKLNVDGENKFLGEDNFTLVVDPDSIFSVGYNNDSLTINLSEDATKDNYSGPHRQVLNFTIQKGDKILISSCIYIDFKTNRFIISGIGNIYIPSISSSGEYYISDAFDFKITDSLNNKVYSNYTINIEDPENKWSKYFKIVNNNNGNFNIIAHPTSGSSHYPINSLLKTEMPLTIEVYDDNWQTIIWNISHSIKILQKTQYNVNIKFLKNYSSFKSGDIIEFYLEHDGELITYNDLREDSKSGYIIKVFVDDSTESLNINHNEEDNYLFNVEIPETDSISGYNLLQIIVEYGQFQEDRNKSWKYTQCGYAKIIRESLIISDLFLNSVPSSINTDKTCELKLPDGLMCYDDKTGNLVSTIVIDRSEIGDKELKFFNSNGKLIWKTDVHLYKTWYAKDPKNPIYYVNNKNTLKGFKIFIPELTNGYDVAFDEGANYNYQDGTITFSDEFEFGNTEDITLTHTINGEEVIVHLKVTPVEIDYNNYIITNNYSIPITLSNSSGVDVKVGAQNMAVLSNVNVSAIKLPYTKDNGEVYTQTVRKPQQATAANCSGVEQPAIAMNIISSYQEFDVSGNVVLTYPYMDNGSVKGGSELELYNAINKTYILKFNLSNAATVDYSSLYENQCASLDSTNGTQRFMCLKYQMNSENNNINIKPIIEWIH